MKQTVPVQFSSVELLILLHGHSLAISPQSLDIREAPAISLFSSNSTFVSNETVRLGFLKQLGELPTHPVMKMSDGDRVAISLRKS